MCNCHSYNWGIGETRNVIMNPPSKFGATRSVCIDACIAHVIETLWACDIWTINSCCGHNELQPSIIFDRLTKAEAKRIRTIIAQVDPREFKLLAWKLTEY